MSSTQTPHPELLEGEILFCYATANSFAAIGTELRDKLRKGTHVPEGFRLARGARREDYFPCFARIADLEPETLARLGHEQPKRRSQLKSRLAWERFMGTEGLVHTPHGYVYPAD